VDRQKEAFDALVRGLRELDDRNGFAYHNKNLVIGSVKLYKGVGQAPAKLIQITDGFLIFDLGNEKTGYIRMSRVDRYIGVSKGDYKRYMGDVRKWKRSLKKWKRRKKIKRGSKPIEPIKPKAKLRWKIGHKILVSLLDCKSSSDDICRTYWIAPDVPQGVLIHVEPETNEVRAIVCGDSYALHSYNRCLSNIQPGSTVKPFVYFTGLVMKVVSSWGIIDIVNPYRFVDEHKMYTYRIPWKEYNGYGIGYDEKIYSPKNYGKYTNKPISIRMALAKSLNSILMQIAMHEDIGYEQVALTMRKFGLYQNAEPRPAMVLGGFEVSLLRLIIAYSAIVNGGKKRPLQFIERIEFMDGMRKEKEIIPPQSVRVYDSASLWLLAYMMRSVVTEGTGRKLKNYPGPIIGKTGTTDESKSTVFVGILPKVASFIAWVGFDIPKRVKGPWRRKSETGSSAPLPIVKYAFEALLSSGVFGKNNSIYKKTFRQAYPPPDGVVCVPFDSEHGTLIDSGDPDTNMECFLKGTEPTKYFISEDDDEEFETIIVPGIPNIINSGFDEDAP
jgi:membrane carboxypeptidase/penicillin-binding protein